MFTPSPRFAAFLTMPVVIDGPGRYVTRSGGFVVISEMLENTSYGCAGRFEGGASEKWNKSGRLFPGAESENDIVASADKAEGVFWKAVDAALVDMEGPYLVTQAVCPLCKTKNRFTLLESLGSPLREALATCKHVHLQRFTEDGTREFGFENWRSEATPEEALAA